MPRGKCCGHSAKRVSACACGCGPSHSGGSEGKDNDGSEIGQGQEGSEGSDGSENEAGSAGNHAFREASEATEGNALKDGIFGQSPQLDKEVERAPAVTSQTAVRRRVLPRRRTEGRPRARDFLDLALGMRRGC